MQKNIVTRRKQGGPHCNSWCRMLALRQTTHVLAFSLYRPREIGSERLDSLSKVTKLANGRSRVLARGSPQSPSRPPHLYGLIKGVVYYDWDLELTPSRTLFFIVTLSRGGSITAPNWHLAKLRLRKVNVPRGRGRNRRPPNCSSIQANSDNLCVFIFPCHWFLFGPQRF